MRPELVVGQNSFRQINLISQCRENSKSRGCLTVTVLLFSGVVDYTLRVLDKGKLLQATVTWQVHLTNVFLLNKLVLVQKKMFTDHPKMSGFQTALRRVQSSIEDDVKSVANIVLPFAVETSFREEPLYWDDTGVPTIVINMTSALDDCSNSTSSKMFTSMIQFDNDVEKSSTARL